MTRDASILTAIDVGTSKVCTIISRLDGEGGFEVLAHSVVPSEGLRKGNVAEISAAKTAVRESIKEAELKAGLQVKSAYVGIAGSHVSFQNRWDKLDWASQHGVITADELTRIPEMVTSSSTTSGRKVIHAIPISYALDGQKGIRDPVGMHSRRLEVETHVVTGGTPFIDKLVAAVERAGVKVEELVLEPLASSEAVLTPRERVKGVVLVDVGGGTTDLIVFKNGSILYTAVIPVGGYQFTNDICMIYNTSYEVAEEVKLRYAHTEPYGARPHDEEEEITLRVGDGKRNLKVLRRDICQLSRERAQELIRLIKVKLDEAELGDLSKVRLVITGGTSQLPGLEGLVRQTLTYNARVGVPNGAGSIPAELMAPAFATSVGILLWAMKQDRPTATRSISDGTRRDGAGPAAVVSRFLKQVRGFWPTHIFTLRGRD